VNGCNSQRLKRNEGGVCGGGGRVAVREIGRVSDLMTYCLLTVYIRSS